jgi:23S rRNA pseudouridine2605 synthase
MPSERIAKRMAALGLCSRREAERWIEQGRVAVNGNILDTPAMLVSAEDVIAIDGIVSKTQKISAPRLFLYHKPQGLVTSHKDEKGRTTVFDALPKNLPRVISVGRLDLNSEGLLLLTTSGALARALELPKNAMERIYRVRINGQITESQMARLARGITVDEVKYRPIHVVPEQGKETGRNRWVTVTLHEGKNREIRRVFDDLSLPVSRLIRVGYGPFGLGNMEPGDVEEVPTRQVKSICTDYDLKYM